MALHNRKLSFTTPIVVGFAGILLSFMLIAIFVTLAQQKDFLEDYHDINRNFTHNLAINYTETLLRENDFILGRAAAFFARNDELNRAVNVEPEKGLTTLMQLQNMMPSVSSISLADTEGHYLRAVLLGKGVMVGMMAVFGQSLLSSLRNPGYLVLAIAIWGGMYWVSKQFCKKHDIN